MGHPAFYAALLIGGVIIVGFKLYEEHKEAKMYEQYQRHRNRYEQEHQQHSHFHRGNNEFDDNSDDEDTVRRRKTFSKHDQNSSSVDHSQYELSDLEATIAERKRRLMAEQAFLDQEEENLRNRKHVLLRSVDDVTHTNSSNFISSNNSSDNDDDGDGNSQSLHDHMTQFDRSQEIVENGSDSTETIIHDKPLHTSTELYYPAASLTPATSTTNSVVSHVNRTSDSEESWDAVSENEWNNQSSVNESDNEYDSHHSIASSSDGENNRIRF